MSEVDLFLRLCPAPTIGITGTKGKTTTSALTHALLATDHDHPAVLGGNIGTPLVERLPELTPRHRVVVELSELQLPTLSRGTTVAAYTNVTSDHLDRHGTLEAYRAVKRRLAELVDPAGALVLNADDPVVAGYAGRRRSACPRPLLARRAARGRPGRRGRLDRQGMGVERLGLAGVGAAGLLRGARHAGRGARALPARTTSRTRWRRRPSRCCSGSTPGEIRHAAGTFEGVEHRLERVAEIDGVRYVNDSQGTQPDAVIAALRAFDAPIVLIAGGRDKGVDLGELAAVVAERATAAVLIGESGPELERLFRGAGLARTERAGSLEEAVDDGVRRSPREAGARRPAVPRPCCSARRRRASTCSRTTRLAAGRSRRPSPASRARPS